MSRVAYNARHSGADPEQLVAKWQELTDRCGEWARMYGELQERNERLTARCEAMEKALREIANTTPAVTLDLSAKVGAKDAAMWNTKRIALAALKDTTK